MQRTFRLRPEESTSQIFLYSLALAAQKTGMEIHAICVMSTHYHAVVTDTKGRLSNFMMELNRATAKALNESQNLSEKLWSGDPYHASVVVDQAALIDRIAYTAANPVAAGLVARPEEWPGVNLWEPTEIDVRRPDVYFSKNGRCPDVARLRIVQPAIAEGHRAEWGERVAHRIRLRVLTAHRELKQADRPFLGRAAVLAESFMKQAVSFEPRRLFIPSVACEDPILLKQAVVALRKFRFEHREAKTKWREGDRDVVFPLGTWEMRRAHGARVATGDCPALRIAA